MGGNPISRSCHALVSPVETHSPPRSALVPRGPATIASRIQPVLVTLLLSGASLFVCTPVAQWGSTERNNHFVFMAATALLGIVYAQGWNHDCFRVRSEKLVFGLALALPCYAAAQCVPLPSALLATLSPARTELLAALQPIQGAVRWAPLTTAVGPTVTHVFLTIGYALIFFMGWRCARDSG